ncbi:MAG TPA: TRAP transporter substrate-binding protein [Burkholderiales bacterium]|nr:TRAP transporter substrate-binding protein [Burkholderiales bacterium]
MKSRISRLTLTAIAALLTATAVQAQFQDRTLKFATQNPKGHPIVTGMEKFAELVAAKSGGKMRVNLFPGGVLGSDQANVSAVQGGTLEIVVLNSGILASQAKEFGIYDFPFMFANPQEADAVVDGPFGKAMHQKLEPKGIVGLAYWELGFRNITNSRRPIAKVDDIAGLKLRVIPNAINVDWVKALDANPTPMPFPEVYAALEQKAIDGQENPVTVINANKFFEVQKFVTLTNHQYNPQSVIFSKKVWDTLSGDEKKILTDAALEAAKFQRQASRSAAGGALDNMKKNGMQVTELTPAELAKFREKMKPVVAKHSEVVGAETVSALQAELAKIRK